MTDDTITDDASIEQKLRTLLTDGDYLHLGSNAIYDTLVNGHPDFGIEPVDGDAAEAVKEWYDGEMDREMAVDMWSEYPSILDHLKTVVIESRRRTIQRNFQTGGLGGSLRAVEGAARDLPDWLALRLLREEFDFVDSRDFDYPKAWQRTIGLLQIEWEGTHYPDCRDDTDNYDDRKEAWDELLKFTKYRGKIKYNTGSSSRTETMTIWAQSSATVHNRLVRRQSDEVEVKSVTVSPIERFQPGDINDPLPDLEDFVYYG